MISLIQIKKITPAIIIVLLLLALCIPLNIIFTSAKFFEVGARNDPVAISSFNKSGSYKIDPETILDSIQTNQLPIFLPEVSVTPDPHLETIFTWSQTEYLKVASALFEFVWKESLDGDWSMHRMSFLTSCKETPSGFESAIFVYNQLMFQNGILEYNARVIEISPNNESVSWGGDTILPRPIRGANSFDLNEVSISADKALTIAEEVGGKTMRQSVQDNCRIGLFLDKVWKVVYFPESKYATIDFEVAIDPRTGEVITSP